jgi:hypothetical protein
MERIHYAGGSVVTGDELARSILTYARALAKRGDSDTVTFPVLLPDGTIGEAEILVGPASQMLTASEVSAHDDLVDPDLIVELASKTEALGIPRPDFEEAHRDADDVEG